MRRFNNKARIASTSALGLVLACASPAFAQGAAQTGAADADETTQPAPETAPLDGSTILVSGLRASLQDAVQQKRNADVIIDGISSDDIGSTPDLNLGEALQRIPGVQIDRSEERRNASVSVRGLPGRFANTSLMGQSIARSGRRNNNGSPFGIFDASIFNGANVVKSFNADTIAGGLSANIDLRLNSALSRKDGLVLRSEVQYEETTQDFNPALFAGFSKRLSDSFGVYGNVAWSKQSFRRDEISINSYNRFSDVRAAQFGVAATASDGTAQHLVFPGELRVQTRNEEGYRLSASGGAEFQVTESLSLRLDGIYTSRNLDNARLDVLRMNFADVGNNPRTGDTTGQISLDPATIMDLGSGEFGNLEGNIFLAPVVTSRNVPYFSDTRVFTGKDEVWALYPAIEFENDTWKGRVVGTISKAVGADNEILVGARRQLISNPSGGNAAARPFQNTLSNGVIVTLNSGAGNFENLSFTTTLPEPLFDFNNRTYTTTNARTTATTVAIPGRGQNNVLITGSPNSVERDLYSIAGDFERKFEFGPFTAFKFGARYDKESGETITFDNTLAGSNLANLDDDIIRDHLGFSTGGEYFGGLIPGVSAGPAIFGVNVDRVIELVSQGGLAPNLAAPLLPVASTTANPLTPDQIAANLAANIAAVTAAAGQGFVIVNTNGTVNANSAVPIDAVISSSGFYNLPSTIATGVPLNRIRQGNFATDRKNFEAYGQFAFNLEDWSASGLPIRGNFGLRYVRAELSGEDTITNPSIPDGPAEGVYSAFLPSANLIWELTDRLQFRAAYYHTFEAFDVAEFTPAPTYSTFTPTNPLATTPQPDDYDVFFSTLDVEPRSSEAFDVLLSWYNRPGGIISLGYFNKSVTVNQRLRLCPVGQSVSAPLFNPATGEIEQTSLGPVYINPNNTDECRIDVLGTQVGDFDDPTIAILQTLQVTQPVTIQGLEAQIQQDLSFLPGPLKNFGVILNVSRVWSEKVDGIEFFNVSEVFGNAILYYEDRLFQGRLAYNYAGEVTLGDGGTFNGLGRTVAPRGQLDFSGAIKPTKNLEVRAEVFNITNSVRRDFQNFEEANRRASYDGLTYALGVTYKY